MRSGVKSSFGLIDVWSIRQFLRCKILYFTVGTICCADLSVEYLVSVASLKSSSTPDEF